ncbi:MAG: hypothetical protein HY079_13500 [Elusimicrobia bacterium]|nr:hypothetical protein [Elusimicrobiota bacterium]
MTRTPAFVVTFLALASAAAAQPAALSQLRSWAGPEAVAASAAWTAAPAPRSVAYRPDGLPALRVYDDGRDDAARLCGRLPFDSDKNSCLQQVSRARYIEREAAAVCAKLSFNDSIPNCLTAISDKAYLRAETDVCAKESFDDDKVNCLRGSGRSEWGQYPGADDHREEAASACSRASFDSDRKDCVQVVGRSYYFDRGAIGVCSALSFSESYPKCFGAIADKEYLPAVLEICAKESFDDDKVSCLRSSGAPWRGLPRWPNPGYPRPHPRRPFPRQPLPPR